jgi:CRISPR-associated exonuclease Cas4
VEQVAMTAALRRKVVQAVAEIHCAVRTEAMPPPPSSRRLCVSCEFRRFCNDVI